MQPVCRLPPLYVHQRPLYPRQGGAACHPSGLPELHGAGPLSGGGPVHRGPPGRGGCERPSDQARGQVPGAGKGARRHPDGGGVCPAGHSVGQVPGTAGARRRCRRATFSGQLPEGGRGAGGPGPLSAGTRTAAISRGTRNAGFGTGIRDAESGPRTQHSELSTPHREQSG